MTRLTRRGFIGAAAGAALAAACAPAAPATGGPSAAVSSRTPVPATPSPKPLAVRGAWVAVTSNQMVWPVAKEAGY